MYIFKPCESIRQIEICRAVVRDTPCGRTLFVRKNTAANVYCTRVGADIIRPRFWQQLVTIHSVGVGDSTHRCRRRRHNMMMIKFSPTTFATYLNEIFYLSQRFGIFFLFEKEKAYKRKANSGLRPETPRTPRRSTWLVLLSRQLGTFARKLASLKQYGLVRLALQAVPSHFSDSRSTAARLLETCSSGFIKSLACLLTMEYISINHCINRGRIISAPTRLHYLSVAVFLRANFVRHYGVSLEMDCKIPLCQVDKLVFPHTFRFAVQSAILCGSNAIT